MTPGFAGKAESARGTERVRKALRDNSGTERRKEAETIQLSGLLLEAIRTHPTSGCDDERDLGAILPHLTLPKCAF